MLQVTGQQTDFVHLIVDIISPIAIAAAGWVGMKIKTAIAEMELKTAQRHADNQKANADLKAELVAYNSKLASDLRDHQTEDAGNFREIRATAH
jgi:hypothetical protein